MDNAYKAQWARENPLKVAEAKLRYAKNNPAADRDASREWRRRNPDYRRNHHLKTRYGISLGERDEMLAEQGGCAVCGTNVAPDRRGWVVDHAHDTNQVRGILCNPCNVAIGFLKDDPALADRVAAYLRRHGA